LLSFASVRAPYIFVKDLIKTIMELLAPPKSFPLLDMAVESLHAQTQEWLSEINFQESEVHFLYDLLSQKIYSEVYGDEAKNMAEMIRTISASEIEGLKKEIEAHERALDQLMTDNSGDEVSFREQHRRLNESFREMDESYKALKTEIFNLVKTARGNFISWNPTLRAIYTRRSVRKFKNKPVDKHLIEELLAAGGMAPSAMDKQPWKFYVVTNKPDLKIFETEVGEIVENLFHLSEMKKDEQKDEHPVFHGAPVIIFITAPRNDEWAAIDIGMCAQNILLACKSLGLDSCAVGLGKFAEQAASYKKLGIRETEEIKLSVVIGYGDESPKAHERLKDKTAFI
jgi:nitroreductase